MTVMETLDTLGNERNGKEIKMANRCGYWWNYRNEEVREVRTNNKYIYLTLKNKT